MASLAQWLERETFKTDESISRLRVRPPREAFLLLLVRLIAGGI